MSAYRLNAPDVVQENFEGEAVLIHFGNGRYFSLNTTGSLVLTWFQEGFGTAAIGAALARITGAELALAEAAVARLLEVLLREEILVVAAAAASGEPQGNSLPWEEPLLTPYTDMTELLLLDPVHEADPSRGWPHQPKA